MSAPLSLATFARKYPLFAAWVLFTAYSAICGSLVQFIVLPFFFPDLHAGHGLLAGTDAVGYHVIAAITADHIRELGWSTWSLAPEGHAAAGLAAPVYYLLGSSPSSLIPVNSAIHATTGIIVMQLMRSVGVPTKIAVASATIWIVFPSSMQWVTQINKDGYFFVGVLGALLGWIMLIDIIQNSRDISTVAFVAGVLAAGITCAGIARQYVFQMLIPIAIAAAGLFIPPIIIKAKLGSIETGKAVTIVGILLIIPIALIFAPRDWYDRMTSAPTSHSHTATTEANKAEIAARKPWRPNATLPAYIDSGFDRLAYGRYGYLSETYKSAGSTIDLDVQFSSASEVIVYLPRALQIGFLAPFPSQWFTRGTSPGGTTMRLIARAEMLILYPLLFIGLPLAIWRWRARTEFWFISIFCTFFIAAFASVTPNMGSLYRMRYGFLMTLAAFGLAALWMTLEERRARRKI